MWAFLTSKLAGPIFAGATALSVIALGVTGVELMISHHHAALLENQVKSLNGRLDQCHSNVTTLEGQLKDQSDKVAVFARGMSDKLSAADHLVAQAQANAASTQRKVTRLQDQLRTAPSGDACKDLQAMDASVMETLK